MKITLVRHGETEMNSLGKLQGRSNVSLNEKGRMKCGELKAKLKDKHYDVCYMSKLVRCCETAMIIVGDRVKTVFDDRLIERGLGELEGQSHDMYDDIGFWNYDLNKSDLEVEPIHDLFSRCSDFLNYIKEKYPSDSSILIVTHSAVYRALRHLILNHKLEGNMYDSKVHNCQCEEFEI